MVGYTIKILQDDLYVVEQPFALYGAELGIRMTIIRLGDNALWLHSPVRFGENLAAQIATLGTVRFIVTPSKMHRLFLPEWLAAHPQATHYMPVGMTLQMSTSKLPTTLSQIAPKEWRGKIEQHETQGIPDLNEVVFFHPQTRTLILTDLCFNIREGSWWTRVLFKLNSGWDHFGPTRIFKRGIQDRVAFRASVDRILRWDFDRIILSHGQMIESGGKELFRTAFEDLL